MLVVRSFLPRARYYVASPANPFNKWAYTVISRTPETVTIQADSGEIRTLNIKIWVYSDLSPFEMVCFKIGSKNIRLSANNPTGPNWTLTGSKFTL